MTYGQTHSKHRLGGGHVKVIGLAIALMTFGQTLQTWGQFANFWYNASHWHHIFQIGLFNFRRHLDQLLLCILTCTSRWLSLKHPLETNSCWQHVTLTSCQPCIPQKKFKDTQNTLYWVVPMCWCIFEAWF